MYKYLVVDDEHLERQAIQLIINRLGMPFQCIGEARHGAEAVAKAQEQHPDLVFLDIKMPGMDGLEAAEAILSNDSDCEVVFLTAYDQFEYAQRGLKIGAFDYLLKPVSPDVIMNVCRRFMDTLSSRPNTSTVREYPVDTWKNMKNLDKAGGVVKTAQEFIEKNLDKNITLEGVTKLVYLNAQYFSRLFKKETGVTFVEYVTTRRLEHAKMLLERQFPVSNVAHSVGYSDPNYFSRVFSKEVGMSPSDYAKSFQHL